MEDNNQGKSNNIFYKKVEEYGSASIETMSKSYLEIIKSLGEDPDREGLQKTPERIAKAMQFMTQGYNQDAEAVVRGAMFTEECSEMVIVKDIEIYSMCEHHMLPFYGRAHVAYIPNGKIVGLSKIARVVDIFARRLQVQERLTQQVLHCLDNTLKPHGVAVVIEASHLCMMMRGVQKQNSVTTTSAFTGQFQEMQTRNEFINLIAARLSK